MENVFIKFWDWFTTKKVRFRFFCFVGFLLAILKIAGVWCFTALVLTCIIAAVNYYFDLLNGTGYDLWSFIAGFASGVTLLYLKYFITNSLSWAHSIADMDKRDFNIGAVALLMTIITTVILGLACFGIYQLCKILP